MVHEVEKDYQQSIEGSCEVKAEMCLRRNIFIPICDIKYKQRTRNYEKIEKNTAVLYAVVCLTVIAIKDTS